MLPKPGEAQSCLSDPGGSWCNRVGRAGERGHHYAARHPTNKARRSAPGVRLVNSRPHRGQPSGGGTRSARWAQTGDRRRRRFKDRPHRLIFHP